jgi:uncharacterized glyoxalase superfamily protein PhnB
MCRPRRRRPERIAMSQTIFPALRYRDPEAAIEFLKRTFGAGEQVVYRRDDGSIQHAQLELEGQLIMLGQASGEGWLAGEPPNPLASTISLYVVVSDPDGHHARAVAAGANVVRELEDMEYGSREYGVRDLEGNLWSFGTYDPSAPDAS